MFLKTKKRILDLIDTVLEMLEVLHKLQSPLDAVLDCEAAVNAILHQLDKEDEYPKKTVMQLQSIHVFFKEFLKDYTLINELSVKELTDKVLLLKEILKEEVKEELNIVFFPYKASMWDSLSSVYEAAKKDKNCVVHVVPIPYYELSGDKDRLVYEGDRFPNDVEITYFKDYNLEVEQPDIIFVHNIYDNYNTLTRVHEYYFTTNLKKYTDMLVYIPYHISSFILPKKGEMRLAYSLPSIDNVDKIIVANEFLREAAILDGVPKEKVIALGSPKIDAMVKSLREDVAYPEGWKEKIDGKRVYLLNTGCMFFAIDPFLSVTVLSNILNISNMDKDSVVIWRPHPLTKVSILKYTPGLAKYYIDLTEKYIKSEMGMYNNIILDETDDYFPALKAADVLISSDGSLLRSYLLTEKKVIFLDKTLPNNSLVPSNAFYYFYNQDEPWYELVKKFAKGYDPLAVNRKGIASKVYANIDGTCGEKVYQEIKRSVLNPKSKGIV